MINLKVLSTVAALALVLPLAAAPTASFAQNHGRGVAAVPIWAAVLRGGGMHMGGGMRTGGQQFNAARVGGGGQQFTGARVSGGSARVGGGGYRYGYRHGGGGFWPARLPAQS